MGVFRSGSSVSSKQSASAGICGALGKDTREGQSPQHTGAQISASGLLHAAAKRGIRYETISGPLIWSGAREPVVLTGISVGARKWSNGLEIHLVIGHTLPL